MPLNPNAPLVITAFSFVPDFARGYVRDLRPRWACEEIGLDYAERLIDVAEKPKRYFREQPFGQVPVIRDGGVEIFESGAILLHIAEKDERLLPSDPQRRARAISWLFAALNSVEPWTLELLVAGFAREEEWPKLRRPSLLDFIGVRLDRLAEALGDKDYLDGASSVGDLAMATVLREAQHAQDGSGLISGRRSLAAYLDRCLARPAFQRALDAQLAVFKRNEPKGGNP